MNPTSQKKITDNLFDKVVEAAPNAMVMINGEGVIMLVNLEAEKLFGYTREELLGAFIEKLVPQRFHANHPHLRKNFFSAPKSRSMGAGRELFGSRKDGTEVPIEIGLNPLEIENETYVLASIIDITERKKADDRFRLAVEAAPNAMIMVDSSGKIVMANKQTEKLFGYDRDQLLGNQIESLVPERFRAQHPGMRAGFLTNPKVRSMGAGRDLYGRKSNGEEVPIEIGLTPVESGTEIFVLASIIDITERKKNEQLISSREAAFEASRIKSQFLANMSHEIRTPLNGIIGLTNMLFATDTTGTQQDLLEGVRVSADALLELINDILDLSKIEADKMELEIVNFSLEQVVADAVSIISTAAKQKKITIRTDINRQLPLWFKGDVAKLKQILINLLGNSIKFTPEGEITLHVKHLSADESPYTLQFEVIDNGIGIAPDVRGRLFEVFTQGDSSTSRKYGGTGLGLSISKKLVEKMDGVIDVDSELGKGSRFWFKLSLPVGEETKSEPTRITSKPTPALKLEHFRILVVEDNMINQKVALGTLKNLGLHGQAVGNGAEAIEMLKKFTFDLVLMDCHMPEMDGYEATQKIRSSGVHSLKSLPIVAMTANVMQGDRERCLEVGMNDYLSKPIAQDELRRVLFKWLPVSDAGYTDTSAPFYVLSTDEISAIDNALADLKKNYGEVVAKDIVKTFLEITPVGLDILEKAYLKMEWPVLLNESHSMKSGSIVLGLTSFSDIASQIELACRLQKDDGLDEKIRKLRAIFKVLEEYYTQRT